MPAKSWHDYFDDGKYADIQGKREDARAQYRQALANLKDTQPNLEKRADIQARLARLDVLEGKEMEAEALSREALATTLNQKARSSYHGELLVAIVDLAESYCLRATQKGSNRFHCLEMTVELLDEPFETPKSRIYRESLRELASLAVIENRTDAMPVLEKKVFDGLSGDDGYKGARDLAAAYRFVGNKEKEKYWFDLAERVYMQRRPNGHLRGDYELQVAEIQCDHGKWDDALKTLTDYMNQHKNKKIAGPILDRLATIYEAKGNEKLAEKYIKLAIAGETTEEHKGPKRRLHQHYASILRQFNRLDEAKIQDQKADELMEGGTL